MQSTQDIEQDSKNSNHHNLVACLALYQHRQDQAIGIDWVSGKVRGLLWYYDRLQQQQIKSFVSASFLNTIIQEGASAIKVLVKQAETAEDKHAIAQKVLEIEKRVNLANEVLEKLADDYQEIIDAKE